MWERLLEIVLFIRTKSHRTLAQILNAFVGKDENKSNISAAERQSLTEMFAFLKGFYAQAGIKASKLATDQPHFYTMVTSIYTLGMVNKYDDLGRRLGAVAKMVDGAAAAPHGKGQTLKQYMELSSKQTTHPGRRDDRQRLFAELVEVA